MNEHWWFVGAGYAITWGTLAWYILRLRAASARQGPIRRGTAGSLGRG